MKKTVLFILKTILFLPAFLLFGTDAEDIPEHVLTIPERSNPAFTQGISRWVDSVFQTMSPEERLGQLFMVAAYPKNGVANRTAVTELIKKYHIGGLIMFQSGPVAQAKLTNYYQSVSKTPLMIAGDYEWGLSMRIDSTIDFPRQMMLGAVQDEKLIYDMGAEIARQCKRMGIHINFAPVIDVNNNPNNPVINSRSFGEQRENVTRKGMNYMLGLQDNHVLAVGKHFPGHGDTEVDSHKDLPVINYSRNRLDSVEIYPFRELINIGLGGVMVAHLSIPTLDSLKNTPSSLSKIIITGILKNELAFKGLIFTDALNMQGVAKYYQPGEVALRSLLAGTDVLLMPGDIPTTFMMIKKAIADGLISQQEIDERCKKILSAKKWFGLDEYKPIELKNLIQDLNRPETDLLVHHLLEASICNVINKNNILPLRRPDTLKIATVSVGNGTINSFQKTIQYYTKTANFCIDKDADYRIFLELLNKLNGFDYIILSYHNTNENPAKQFGISQNSIEFYKKLVAKSKLITLVFGNAYSLKYFESETNPEALVCAFNDWNLTREIAAQMVFGGIPFAGLLPVSVSPEIKAGTGEVSEKIRLKYSIPEDIKIRSERLRKVDTLIMNGIREGAMPGATVMCIKDGVVFFYKSYGKHTYTSTEKNQNLDIYDLASLTKISATMPTLMKLYEEKKFDLGKKMASYIPELLATNKKNITILDVLTHQARLTPWIPFYLATYINLKNHILNKELYSPVKTEEFSYQVADNLYITPKYRDTIYQRIYDSKLLRRTKYKYSDLGFFLFYKVIENITQQPLEVFTQQNFYGPLGAYTMGYRPLERFPKEEIIPTEDDETYRRQLIQGYVHDYGAAMMNGVGGHAGLFAAANDLAKLMQMYVQGGEYGGIRFLKPETIQLFTSDRKDKIQNRRGLGFDKMSKSGKGPACNLVSDESYGHTGFTGTMVWVDPKYNCVYIFLSNRINPSIENSKLNDLNIRAKVQRVFYESFLGLRPIVNESLQ